MSFSIFKKPTVYKCLNMLGINQVTSFNETFSSHSPVHRGTQKQPHRTMEERLRSLMRGVILLFNQYLRLIL